MENDSIAGKLYKKRPQIAIDLNELYLFYLLFQLSSERLCRAIVWNAIVLGGNKKGGRLSGGNYLKAIYLGSIIQRQFFRGKLFGCNYQWSIILGDNSFLGAITWESILGGEIVWGQLPWRGAIVWRAIIRREVVLLPFFIFTLNKVSYTSLRNIFHGPQLISDQ